MLLIQCDLWSINGAQVLKLCLGSLIVQPTCMAYSPDLCITYFTSNLVHYYHPGFIAIFSKGSLSLSLSLSLSHTHTHKGHHAKTNYTIYIVKCQSESDTDRERERERPEGI